MSHVPTVLPRGVSAGAAPGRGMACMIGGMMLLPVGDSFTKILTSVVGPVEVTMWRLLAQSLILAPVVFILRDRLRGPMFSPVVAVSGALLAALMASLIAAFAVMPIATAIAIFFVEPLLLTLLAGPFLGEVPGPRRLAAVGVGLIGAMIVIRPGFSEFGWATLLPLLSAFCYALNMILLRRASAARSGLTMQFGATIYAMAFMLLLALGLHLTGSISIAPAALPSWAWGAILGAGAFAAVSYFLIVEAFRNAEAGVLAPLQYLEIIGAAAAGYFIFGDFPDALTLLGVAIILASGVYVFHRERQASMAALS